MIFVSDIISGSIMKKKFYSKVALLLAAAMLFATAGCNGAQSSSSEISADGNQQGEVASTGDNTTLIGGDITPSGSTSGAASTGGGKVKTPSSSEFPASIKGKTIEVFNWNPPTEYTELPSLISAFEKASGCKIKWTISAYSDYNVELAARVAANNSPDVLRFICANVAELELAQPLSNSGYNFSGSEWDHTLMDYYTVNGKCYATNTANSLMVSPYLIAYNKDLVGRYDFEDPYTLWKNGKWTMEKLIEMSKEFYKITGTPGCHVYKYDSYLLHCGYSGIMSYKNGRYSSNMSDKKCLSIWQKMYNWYNTDGVFYNKSWDSEGFQSGKYLFMEVMAIHLRTSNPFYSDLISTGAMGVVPWPKPLSADSTTDYTAIGEYEAYGIAKGAKNAAAVPYYLAYVLNSDNLGNKSGYFYSNEALKVYESVMSNKNRIQHTRYPDGQMDSCATIDPIYYGVGAQTPSQLSSFVSSNKAKVENFVNGLNKRLSVMN